MMVKHTPGPWAITDHNEAGDFYIGRTDAPEYVAIVTGGPFLAAEITQANARLIAAAPEMLAALEAILPLALQFSNGYDDQLAQVHAAIAAARGQEAT